MKKITLIITAFTILFITLVSCNKDQELVQTEPQIDQTELKILAFKSKVESPVNPKSEETISVDSAIWYIEALLNYSYCEVNSAEVVKIDSVFVTIPTSSNGDFNINNVVEAYYQFNTDLNEMIDHNKMRITDISYVENDSKANTTTLKLTTVITGSVVPTISFTFGDTDYWRPVYGDGKCDIYSGQFIGYDAGTKLQSRTNYRIAYYLPYGYSTSVEVISTGAYWGYQEYYWQGSENSCINPDEMNYWLSQVYTLTQLLTPSEEKRILYVNYDVDGYVGGSYLYHKADLSYGIWNVKNIPNQDQ